MDCYCGSKKEFEACCAPLLAGEISARSPLALMRSRYTAYALGRGDYLVETTVPSRRVPEDAAMIAEHAANTQWLGLRVIAFEEKGSRGTVEFKAYYRGAETIAVHHERSVFLKLDGRWYYDTGTLYEASVGRNEPCPCGSGKKYKKCCAKRT